MCLRAHVRKSIVRISTYGEMHIKRSIIVSLLHDVFNRAIKFKTFHGWDVQHAGEVENYKISP